MKLQPAVALLPLIALAACDSTTGPLTLQPEEPLAAISDGMEMLRQYEGFSALAVTVVSTGAYQPLFTQYNITRVQMSGTLADDFVVPFGSTWRVTHVAMIGELHPTYFDQVHFYHDAPGAPGDLLATLGVTILKRQEIYWGFSWFYLMQLDEPLVLGAGRYWLAADLVHLSGGHTFRSWWEYAVMDDSHPLMRRDPDTHEWSGVPASRWPPYTHGNENLAFGLYSRAVMLEDVHTAFDGWVDAGTLTGAGAGQSAAGRLGALRNMLVEAGNLFESGDLAGACTQLWDAYLRTDGHPRPPDFVTGPSASLLADLILEARDQMGCL
jgi:hypothetical protein